MQNDRLVIWAGIVVILAIIALAAFVVAALAASGPAVAAGVLTAVAAVLAVIPPIIGRSGAGKRWLRPRRNSAASMAA